MTNDIELSFPTIVDTTILGEFLICMRRGYHSYIQHLRAGGKSPELISGGAFAAGIEHTRRWYYGRGVSEEEALAKGIEATIKHFNGYIPPDKKPHRGVDSTVGALIYFFSQFPMRTDPIQPLMLPDGQPAVEFTSSIPLPIKHPETDEPIIHVGRFDMVAKYKGSVWANDEKTANRLGPTWSAQWDLDSQPTAYVWHLQQHGYPANGAIIRGTRFSSNYECVTALALRSPHMVEEWYRATLATLEEMKTAWHAGYWKPNLKSGCLAYYRPCPYIPLCQSDKPERWYSDYQIVKWNPLREREELEESKV